MKNAWLKRHVRRQLFTMPTTLNEDREIEYAEVRGARIPALIRFWRRHAKRGSLSKAEYAAIAGIIICMFERETGIVLEGDTL